MQLTTTAAAQVLTRGALLAYPTEAVFGLGCDPYQKAAIDKLYQLKGRPSGKGVILIAHDFADLVPFLSLSDVPPDHVAKAQASWPGAHTWVFPASEQAVALIGDYDSIAVRVTAHPPAVALCRAFQGPIVSTSANVSGAPPAKTPETVREYFGAALPVMAGAVGALIAPTPIQDVLSLAFYRR